MTAVRQLDPENDALAGPVGGSMQAQPKSRRWVLALVLVTGAWTALAAQTPAQKPHVTMASRPPIVSVAGADNYDAYCAVCHGRDGKGNGPAAPAMKAPVPDLTTFAQRHGGRFDPLRVQNIVTGSGKIATPAHGVEDMPIWGNAFNVSEAHYLLRINNLVKYLESVQQAAPTTVR